MNTMTQRREFLFSGTVQGVGFRFTARRIAQRFKVSGHVQNLSDGRVKVIAEGIPNEIERFLVAIESELGGYVTRIEQETLPATGEFHSFEIRF